jgi:hypothetical protein
MKNYQLSGLLIASLLMIPGVVGANEVPNVYMEMSSQYEAIRLALLEDSTEGVAEHAKSIQDLAKGQLEHFDAGRFIVPDQDIATFEAALQDIQTAASNLSSAGSLAPARETFFALTKPMVRYRKLSGGQDSVVAYCPMAQKAWIQPQGEIGNPYMGQQMPSCGEIVGE